MPCVAPAWHLLAIIQFKRWPKQWYKLFQGICFAIMQLVWSKQRALGGVTCAWLANMHVRSVGISTFVDKAMNADSSCVFCASSCMYSWWINHSTAGSRHFLFLVLGLHNLLPYFYFEIARPKPFTCQATAADNPSQTLNHKLWTTNTLATWLDSINAVKSFRWSGV